MLEICGDTISKPLELIFGQAVITGAHSSDWKKGNIIPVHKKDDKLKIKNYHPMSLLPIYGKVFERILFNKMFSFFLENKLITQKQS